MRLPGANGAARVPVDFASILGTGLAVSLATLPLVYLWVSALDCPLLYPVVAPILAAILTVLAFLSLHNKPESSSNLPVEHCLLAQACFAVMFILILFLRTLNIDGYALPLWVDSVHHSALARLIISGQTLPSSFRPFAEVDAVYYHVGYHATIAFIAELLHAPVEGTMLWFGQLLNAMVPVTGYVLARRWTGRATAGLLAMLIIGILSLMPAYYVTWGRYTQLDGLVILPIAMLFWQSAIERGSWCQTALTGLLTSGLFLVHVRVTILLLTFVRPLSYGNSFSIAATCA